MISTDITTENTKWPNAVCQNNSDNYALTAKRNKDYCEYRFDRMLDSTQRYY